MLTLFANLTYRRLFAAQVLSLIGSGLTTVALGLLAYDLAGEHAGAVLGTALMLKMVAYVGVAPVASAVSTYLPRRSLLVGLDVCRAALVFLLPFVDQIWQVYLLVFVFQLFSAAFTPTFQATIPDVLPDEEQYTKALSLSRLTYDLESLLSPLLAGLLLSVISFHWLFVGTTLGFIASAVLVLSVTLPAVIAKTGYAPDDERFSRRVMRGIRIYLATPRLRGLLALNFAVSSVGAMVIVNTVVYVQVVLGGNEQTYTTVLMAYGLGSMLVALLLPRLLGSISARRTMLSGAFVLALAAGIAALGPTLHQAWLIWLVLGAGSALVLTPGGLLLRRSAQPEDRVALFAAQFALSHACWLITYPLAGWLGIAAGLDITFLVMAGGALAGALLAMRLWPAGADALEQPHEHTALEHEHLHVHDEHHQHEHAGWEGPEPHRHPHRHKPLRHRHVFVIDDHHPIWPQQ
ncbi:MAG: MFS transporter [Gammaproteobacteria bacterium]